jgi:hypothetical protein
MQIIKGNFPPSTLPGATLKKIIPDNAAQVTLQVGTANRITRTQIHEAKNGKLITLVLFVNDMSKPVYRLLYRFIKKQNNFVHPGKILVFQVFQKQSSRLYIPLVHADLVLPGVIKPRTAYDLFFITFHNALNFSIRNIAK